MTITMSYEEYNKMQEFAKQFAARKGGTRPILEYIKISISGDTVEAEALDGYKGGIIRLAASEVEGDGDILLPVTGKLKRSDIFATIVDAGDGVEITTATGTMIYKKPYGEYFDTSKIYPEDPPSEVFGFDPVLLSDALKAFKGEKAVKIEYRGTLKPLVIKSSTAQALVMPVRLPQ